MPRLVHISGNRLLTLGVAQNKSVLISVGGKEIANWTKPNGGYFISLDVMEGCAKRVETLCKEAGMILTTVGATYPYGKDPKDTNIRIAPSFPSVDDIAKASKLLCTATKYAAIEKLLK